MISYDKLRKNIEVMITLHYTIRIQDIHSHMKGCTMNRENPFTITFGKQPNKLVSRYEDSDRMISTFEADNAVSQTFLIQGLRGSGKTVLMTSVAKVLEEKDNWIVINLNPTMDLLSSFAARISEAASNKPEVLSRGFNVSAAGFGVGVDGDNRDTDYVGIIDKAFKTVIKKKKRVLITIDEVVHDDNMRIFASQFQIFVRQDYPIFLIMTGLYENIYEIQNDPSLTFLLRAPKITTGPLSIMQITRQYRDIFEIDEERAGELAAMTKGYAFAFQALGVCLWDYEKDGMNTVIEKFEELLDDFVYKKVWMSLTMREKEILSAMTEDEQKIGVICKKISMSSGSFSKYRESLMQKGIVTAGNYGYISLLLPRFRSVIKNYRI